MKRLLPLIALSLLLLAPAARGSEVEDLEAGVQEAAAKVEVLRAELDETQGEVKRAALEERVDAARTLLRARRAELAKVHAALAVAKEQQAAFRSQAEEMLQKTTATQRQVEARRKTLLDAGDAKRAKAFEPTVQRAAQNLGQALEVLDVLERTRQRIERGELAEVRHGLLEAEARLDDLRMWLREEQKQKRAAAAAERASEEAHRVREAARIAALVEQAQRGIEAAKTTRARLETLIKRASDPEDVEEIERIRERWAHFEKHAAEFHIAKGWLEKARAHLAGMRPEEAKKATEVAKKRLDEASRKPLDDGSPSWPIAAELRAELHRMEEQRKVAARALEHAVQAREQFRSALERADPDERQDAAPGLRQRGARLQERADLLKAVLAALEKTRRLIDDERYVEAKKAYEEAKARLAHALREDTPRDVRLFSESNLKEQAALRARIQSLEDERVVLEQTVTPQHPGWIRCTRQLEAARKRLVALEGEGRSFVVDEDGRYVVRGLVSGEGEVEVIVPAPTFTTQRGSVRIVGRTLEEAKTRERIEHLRQAARHLHQAGQPEQAERLEREARGLEERLGRSRGGRVGVGGNARVLEAIQDLRREVRALRGEVKELKELILQGR